MDIIYYPNPLHPDPEHREIVIPHLKKVIEAAAFLEVPIVGTFVGKDKTKRSHRIWMITLKAGQPSSDSPKSMVLRLPSRTVRCYSSYDEWPGGNNLASSLAIWRKIWENIPNDNFGLTLDPSHLILHMIDYERVVREFSDKIFHVHAKDLHIDWEGVYNHSVLS
ncbi:MAG: sugar phosphate isomerase/epimerase [Anaerolineales bacterium]